MMSGEYANETMIPDKELCPYREECPSKNCEGCEYQKDEK